MNVHLQSKYLRFSLEYVNIPEDYLTFVEAPTEENVLSTYDRYSKS